LKTIVITDLDDTLLTSKKELSRRNIQSLKTLRDRGIIVTVATGRPLHFIKKVKGLESLSDYFITSTGLGIWSCSRKEMIFTRAFSSEKTKEISSFLIDNGISFMRHKTLPDNHFCSLYRGPGENDDLDRRADNFRDFCSPLLKEEKSEASVFMLPGISDSGMVDFFREKLEGISVEILTSPYNRDKFWVEILPEDVNKGSAVSWLTGHLNVSEGERIVIGNDHNDRTMLSLSERSFVVANAPDELKKRFTATDSDCNDNGFTEALQKAGLI